MSVSLKKGQKISLSKNAPAGLSKVMIGLGWDPIKKSGGFLSSLFGGVADFDLDASVFLLQSGKLRDDYNDLVYFGTLRHRSGAVRHMGDNLTGGGEGDDEQIFIDFTLLPREYDRLVVVVNIFQAYERKQDFGQVRNAFIRIVDFQKRQEMCRFDLSGDYSGLPAMIFGELCKEDNEWKFIAVGEGTRDRGLKDMARRYQ